MTFLNKSYKLLSKPPINEEINSDSWKKWLSDLHDDFLNKSALHNPSLLLNGDFNFEPTLLTGAGDFAQRWNIDGNNFEANPTTYASSIYSNETGSAQYFNIKGNDVGQNLVISQNQENKIATAQGKNLNFSLLLANKKTETAGSKPLNIKFRLGYDHNGNGTVDEYHDSGNIIVPATESGKPQLINAHISPPTLNNDSRPNKLHYIINVNSQSKTDFNIFNTKLETGVKPSILRIDHTLEKYRIDNTT